jgi:general secretion pathway protein E
VLTTLHTETAAAAVPRLLDLGIEAFLLSSTLRAVVAQRLVRVLCDRCKKSHVLTQQDITRDPHLDMLGFQCDEVINEAVGCERCSGTGYRGRLGAFEILEMNNRIRSLVRPQTDSTTLDQAAIEGGMTTMLQDAVLKCRTGVTTVREVLRVTTVR